MALVLNNWGPTRLFRNHYTAGDPLGTQKRMSRMKISIPFGFL